MGICCIFINLTQQGLFSHQMKNNYKHVNNQIIFINFFGMPGTKYKLLHVHQSLG